MSSTKVKRIFHENKILNQDRLNIATAYPFEDGMNVWYALFIGPYDSVYKGGQYICKIILSENYPFTPPDFVFLTPSGRFEINKKICLTITGFHSDMWQSTITIKTMLIQVFSVFYQDADNGIAHLIPPASGTSSFERKNYAKNSIAYNLVNYKEIYENFDFTYLNDGSPEEINKKIKNNVQEIINTEKNDIKEIINTEKNDVKKENIDKINNNEIINNEINNNEIKNNIVKRRGRPCKIKLDNNNNSK